MGMNARVDNPLTAHSH